MIVFKKLKIIFLSFLKSIKKKQHVERLHVLNVLVKPHGKRPLKRVTYWKNNPIDFLEISFSCKIYSMKREQRGRCSGVGSLFNQPWLQSLPSYFGISVSLFLCCQLFQSPEALFSVTIPEVHSIHFLESLAESLYNSLRAMV